MKFRLIPLLLLLTMSPQITSAKEPTRLKDLWVIPAFEAGLIAHSWLLSRSPYAYGIASGLIYPLTGVESKRGTAFWTSLAAAEAMNLYTIGMEINDVSQDEIFKRNVIGWHLVFATLVVSHVVLDKDSKARRSTSNRFSFVPTEYGGQLRYDFKF